MLKFGSSLSTQNFWVQTALFGLDPDEHGCEDGHAEQGRAHDRIETDEPPPVGAPGPPAHQVPPYEPDHCTQTKYRQDRKEPHPVIVQQVDRLRAPKVFRRDDPKSDLQRSQGSKTEEHG